MRRVGAIVLCAILLTGCAQGGDSARNYNKKNDVADIINAAISSAVAAAATDGAPVETQAKTEEVVNATQATEETAVIEVVGVFDSYMEGEYTYCTLKNATLTIR